MEKALAKFLGNYENLEGGLLGPGIQIMTGAPYQVYWHKDIDADSLWTVISESKAAGSMVTAGSYVGTGNNQDQNKVGLAFAHAYSVLETVSLSNGDRLLALRNPWGKETFNGTYSDSGQAWTDELRLEANHSDSNDGKFFITIEEYLQHLEYTNINFDVTDAYQAYFLVLNDTYIKRGTEAECGVNCTMHQFFVESEIDQEILISAQTWDIK